MKTVLAFVGLVVLTACGEQLTRDEVRPAPSQTAPLAPTNPAPAGLWLQFSDGTMAPYPTTVEFASEQSQKGLCLQQDGAAYVLHVLVRNISEVPGTFVLSINGVAMAPLAIGSATMVEVTATVTGPGVFTLRLTSDQTSARGGAAHPTGFLQTDIALSQDC